MNALAGFFAIGIPFFGFVVPAAVESGHTKGLIITIIAVLIVGALLGEEEAEKMLKSDKAEG